MVRSPDTVTTQLQPADKIPPASQSSDIELVGKQFVREHFGIVNVELALSLLKAACDRICDENPDNYLFFTKYGGAVTQEKYDQDNNTDLDLRLVCFEMPSEDEQQRVREELQAIAGRIPVELYFHTFNKYVIGEVGETGETTVLEKIQSPDENEESVVNIEYPSLLSFYTFATMEFFTSRTDHELEDWSQTVTQNYLKKTGSSEISLLPNLEMIDPQNIVEQISITERDVIEWIHVYVEHFLHDFKAFHSLKESDQNNKEILQTYLSRISKYLARVAFGVAIVDRNSFPLSEVEEKYLQHLRLGISAELAHFQVTSAISPSWFNTAIKDTIRLATYVRTSSKFLFDEAIDSSEYYELISQIENTLLYIVQQGGGLIRRTEFNDVHDFLSEHAILNQVESNGSKFSRETVPGGRVILEQGSNSQEIILIPTHKSDGTKNGTYKITVDGEVVALDRSKIIVGELGVLLDMPRTTSVVAAEDLEMIQVPKEEIKRLFTDSFSIVEGGQERSLLENYFTGYYILRENELEDTQDAQLIFSFLAYLSDEFFMYLDEALKSGRSFKSQSENPQDSLLDLYEIDHLPACFDWLVAHDKEGVFTVTDYDQPVELFTNGEKSDFVYFIHSASESGGIEITFNDGSKSVLSTGEIVGEDAFLPNGSTRRYSARVLPGTKLVSATSEDFRDATATTDVMFAKVNDDKGKEQLKQHTRREVFFALGVQCLKRLQTAYS